MKTIFRQLAAALSLAVVLASVQTAGAQSSPSDTADGLFAAGNYQAAAAEYRKLIAAGTDLGHSWFELGASLQRLKNYTDARAAYAEALRLQYAPPNVYYQLARMDSLTGHTASAIANLKHMTALGFVPEGQLTLQPDFASIQSDPGFVAIVAGIHKAMHPCLSDPLNRAMDFWIGDWDVRNAGGTIVGSSHVETLMDRCIIFENWAGRYGDLGKSFSHYDSALKHWAQYYVAQASTGTLWAGNPSGASVVFLSGSGKSLQRMTFTKLPDGRVRQLFENSTDGTTWITASDFYYERHAK